MRKPRDMEFEDQCKTCRYSKRCVELECTDCPLYKFDPDDIPAMCCACTQLHDDGEETCRYYEKDGKDDSEKQ